jgi:hypothetical protein
MLTALEVLALKLLLVAFVRVFAIVCVVAFSCAALSALIVAAWLRTVAPNDGEEPHLVASDWEDLW